MKRSYLFAATALALSLAGCGTTIGSSSSAAGTSSNGTSSAGTSEKTSSAGTTSSASAGTSTGTSQGTSKGTSEGTSQGGTSSGTSSGTSEGTSQGTSSETSKPTGTKTIYFEDQPWWNAYADYPMALLTGSDGTTVNTPADAPKDSTGATIPGVKMTAVGTHTISDGKVNNFWSIDVDLSVYATVQFVRYGYDEAKTTYWAGNAKTDSLTISALGENDLYVLTETETYFDAKGAAGTTLSKYDSSMIDAPVEYVTVTLDLNYDGAPAATTVKAEKGKTMSKPSATRSGYTLEGWYTDAACTSAFDFTTLVSADFTLYAKWTEGAVAGEHDNGGSLTTFYIRGAVNGSTDWTTGIQMYTDAVSTNKALYLNIAMLVGDSFKVVDMTSGTAQWNGFDAVDSASTAYSNFSGKEDGYGGKNISVVTAGSYDIYFSSASKIVLNLHA